MEIVTLILYGLGLSFFGVLPPGIININTALISVERGVSKGVIFALGACFIVFLQTLFSILVAMNISIEEISFDMIDKIAAGIFFALSLYFFICGRKKPRPKNITKDVNRKAFLKGVFFASINFLPIPYYIFWSATLNARNKFDFDVLHISIFSLAVIVGTFVANYLYIIFFKRYKMEPAKFAVYANYALALVTFAVGIVQVVKVNLLS